MKLLSRNGVTSISTREPGTNQSSSRCVVGRDLELCRIPDAALELLASLPGYAGRADDPDGLVFPSSHGTELENWERITVAIKRESQTASWHRHDLRRTSATIMRAIGIDLSTIDRILGHKTAYRREETSPALDAYLSDIALDDIAEDPQRSALEKLADVYKRIERRPETPVGEGQDQDWSRFIART